MYTVNPLLSAPPPHPALSNKALFSSLLIVHSQIN